MSKAYQREYRRKRRAEGRPVVSGKMSREWRLAYNRAYADRPGVRARTAAKARASRRDPQEQMKAAARRLLRSAIEAGDVVRQSCEVCQATPTDGHHSDYLQPLNVQWLCRIHHHAVHKEAKK